MTIRLPTTVQKNTRAIPSAPFNRSSNSPSPNAVWLSEVGAERNHTTGQHDVPCSEGIGQVQDISLHGLAVVGDRVVHSGRITIMLLMCKQVNQWRRYTWRGEASSET